MITSSNKIDRRTAGKATEAAKRLVDSAISLGIIHPADADGFLDAATSADFSELAQVIDQAQQDNRSV